MDRKKLTRAYKDRKKPMGVFRVFNQVDGKSFVASSVDVPAALNRQRFQLGAGVHPNPALQADWNRLGPEAFAFEPLDMLEVSDDAKSDPAEELRVLEQLWHDKLSPYGERGYNVMDAPRSR